MLNRAFHGCQVRNKQRKRQSSTFRPAVEPLECRRLLAFTVTSLLDTGDANPGDGLAEDAAGNATLRAAIEESNALEGPNTIDFDLRGPRATITLENGELAITDALTIQGPGAKNLAVSGDGASRVFSIAGVEVTMYGLTITHGRAVQGGGIANFGGTLTVADCTFSENQAIGADGTTEVNGQAANGGALLNLGLAHVSDCTFTDNLAMGGGGGEGTRAGNAAGGAVANRFGAVLTIYDSKFYNNRVVGGHRTAVFVPDQPNGNSAGGAIVNNFGSTVSIASTIFSHNWARGGDGAPGVSGGVPLGGALANFFRAGVVVGPDATAEVTDTRFDDNTAIGGQGGAGAPGGGASGGAIFSELATLSIADSRVTGNLAQGGAGGQGADGGLGEAGALSNADGTLTTIIDTQISYNQAIGGAGGVGGNGGAALGGGVINFSFPETEPGVLSVIDSTLRHNQALGGTGGAGGNGGDAFGGGFYQEGPGTQTMFHDVSIHGNLALGGAGVIGGSAFGGGVAAAPSMFAPDAGAGTIVFQNSIVRDNEALGGSGSATDGEGIGGGLYSNGALVILEDSKVKKNHASTAHDDIYFESATLAELALLRFDADLLDALSTR